MSRWPSVLLAGCVVAGCERSAVNATDSISLTGVTQDAAGAAQGGVEVKLYRGAPRTDGSMCPLLKGDPWKTATTTADGHYSFSFTGKDSQTSDVLGAGEGGDLARCFRLTAAGPGESLASAHFTVQLTTPVAPALRDYDAAVQVTTAAGQANFSWSGPADATPTSYALALETTGGDPLWSLSASGTTTTGSVPDYVFEGLESRARVTASSETKGSGTIWAMDTRSAAAAVPARGTVPLSRGASCDLATPCPLTDGVFRSASVGREVVTLTFATPLPLARVLVRGLSASGDRLVVEVSTDGTAFTTLADVAYHGGDYDLAAPAATTARALRLKAASTSNTNAMPKLNALSEVSVVP